MGNLFHLNKARYNRISSPNQKLERQVVRNYPNEIIFNDVVSGAVAFKDREKGKELIKAIEAGSRERGGTKGR